MIDFHKISVSFKKCENQIYNLGSERLCTMFQLISHMGTIKECSCLRVVKLPLNKLAHLLNI